MKLIHLNIPSRTIPNNVTRLQDGVFCFHSNEMNESLGLFNKCIGFIVDIEIHNNYKRIISDFITTLNVFRQEYASIQWLSNLNYEKYIIITNQDISEYIDSHKNNNERKVYFEDLNRLQVQIIGNSSIHYSFIDVFNKLVLLDKNEFILNALNYLAASNSIIMTSNRIYDNAFFENALLFQLFEAIMVDYEGKYSVENRVCGECKKEIKMGLKSRIDRFLKDIQIANPVIIKTVKIIAETRHKFFHSLSGLSQNDLIDEVLTKVNDNYISYDDELKYADGTLLGKGVLKQIITIYLIENLLNRDV